MMGPRRLVRGIVITSDDRGAYLAGDTIGVNTSYREEQINDEDLTPLDRAQDVERDMRINNDFIAEESVVASSDRGEAVPITEAERTAKAYGSQKLYFKNLGPGSNGAMAEGDAVLALDRARQWQQSLPDTLAYYRSLNPWTTTVTSHLSSVQLWSGVFSQSEPEVSKRPWGLLSVLSRHFPRQPL